MVVLGRILVAQVCQRFSRGDMIFRRPQPFGAGLVPGKQHGVFVFGNARIQGAVAFGRTATPQFRRCTESAVDEDANVLRPNRGPERSEEHTSELQSLMRISYAVFCLKKKQTTT